MITIKTPISRVMMPCSAACSASSPLRERQLPVVVVVVFLPSADEQFAISLAGGKIEGATPPGDRPPAQLDASSRSPVIPRIVRDAEVPGQSRPPQHVKVRLRPPRLGK